MSNFREATIIDLPNIRYMDAECFPNDTPFKYNPLQDKWFIETNCIAYCAWTPMLGINIGYLLRAGVMPSHRGKGLQKIMINLRESSMRKQGFLVSITYTDADNFASMNNMIAMGYKTYNPKENKNLPLLSGEGRLGRVGFVHWYKYL